MKSSSGAHFIALDHVRAFAALMVVTWHFIHAKGVAVPMSYVPAFPFAILDEGHTGVALFMALSGYLFAKLLDGRQIDYGAFLWNRALRLLPLLIVVIAIVGIQKALSGQFSSYADAIARGALFPSLPNGGWSITVEAHYYLILPLLLWLLKKSKLPLIILAALALRFALHDKFGEIQSLSYWTLIGRIDQFVLGMLAYQLRAHISHRHVLFACVATAFLLFYWMFDMQGGFYRNPSYPSPSLIWVVLPTIEGLAYAIGIAWYDNSFKPSTSGVSRFIGRMGEYSYSIYLLHFFFVFDAARLVSAFVDLSNFYVSILWAMAFFALMMVPGYLSFRFIEAPFLKFRRRYIMSFIKDVDFPQIEICSSSDRRNPNPI